MGANDDDDEVFSEDQDQLARTKICTGCNLPLITAYVPQIWPYLIVVLLAQKEKVSAQTRFQLSCSQ